jgi:ubiquinone/menaquinone biosynthesis C-methylase UbiE
MFLEKRIKPIWESHHGKGPFIRSLPPGARILDVGCGNNSPSYVKNMRPDLYYIGLDVGDYNQDNTSLIAANEYHVSTPSRFTESIERFYLTIDGVVSSHNLEHCDDYRAVLRAMARTLKPGGRMYLSFPCEASVRFPHRQGCLNFFDDPTHQYLLPWASIIEELASLGMLFEFRSRRYRPLALALIGLLYEPSSAIRREVATNGATWALYGFESVIWARRAIAGTPTENALDERATHGHGPSGILGSVSPVASPVRNLLEPEQRHRLTGDQSIGPQNLGERRLPRAIRCTSFEEYKLFMSSSANQGPDIEAFEAGLLGAESFAVPGYCAVCDREAAFLVDHLHCFTAPDGRRIPNWRERLLCSHCHLSNRMRAAAAFLFSVSKPDDAVYLTEFVTPFFRVIASKRERTIGSEYLRDGTARGATNAAGVRHEDATCLTFPDRAFDVIGTFDVLEHVPDYRQALTEFFRCLRSGGKLIITVPFHLWSASTITRATIDASGNITHLLPPEMHGDPLDQGGALCFYHFGWDFVDALAQVGFEDAGLSMFWDAQLGYLGGYQFIITSQKTALPP